MSRQAILANGSAYTLSLDGPVAEAERFWAVVTGRAIDEITGQAPRTPIRVTTAEPALLAKVDRNGAFCLVARPWLRFPPLAAPTWSIRLTVTAEGYVPLTRAVALPNGQRQLTANVGAGSRLVGLSSTTGLYAGQILLVGPHGATAERCQIAELGPGAGQVTLAAGLINSHNALDPVVPDTFAPVTLHDVSLRRRPVVIRGRAVARTTGGTTPVPNATIRVAGLWRTLANVRAHLPPVPAKMVSVQPGLYAHHLTAEPIAEIPFAATTGEDKLLQSPVAAGSAHLPLGDRVNLVAGSSVVVIEPGDPARQERLLVTALEPSLSPLDATAATLNFPLQHDHAENNRVVRVVPGAPLGANKHLTDDAAVGDQTLFLDNTAFAAGSGTVRLGAAATVEFHQFVRFQTTSDSEGFFVLPPLHRIAQIAVEASAAGHPPINAAHNNTIVFQPDYAAPENRLDVVFET